MTVSLATFRTTFPEFSDVSDAKCNVWLANSQLMVNSQVYGSKYDLAVYAHTAHLLVTGENLSVTPQKFPYQPLDSDSNYARTAYGQMYLTLKLSVSGLLGANVFSGAEDEV